MTIKRIFISILCILLCNVCCKAQVRSKIDRSDTTSTSTQTGTTAKTDTTAKTGGNGTTSSTNSSKSSQSKTATAQATTLSVSTSNLSFPASGGSKSITVTANSYWYISTNTNNWGHLTRNDNTLTLRVDANNLSSSRTDYFEIKSGDKTVRVNISQEKADILLVSAEQLSFPASGGVLTVTVTASGTWNIGTKTYDWGHLTTNGNTVVVRVDANENTSARGDYFTIRSGNHEKTINISQSGVTLTAQDLERIEKEKYESACQRGTTDALLEYLKEYPNGRYANSVSNKIAIAKAKSLNKFSTSRAFNEALGYAKDSSTRSFVQQCINNCEREYAQYLKQQEKAQHKQKVKKDGGYVQFGIEAMDFAWNCVSLDRYLNVFYYNIGLSMRIGNFRTPVQLELGLKPGLLCSYEAEDDWWHGYGYYEDDVDVGFHLPIYTRLKINICNSGDYSKFYIAGMGYYNAVRDKGLENKFSVGCGAGFAWRHGDLMFYYKQDLNNKHGFDDKYIGSSLVFYF